MSAEQLASAPPAVPLQVQVHGPSPATALGVPASQRFSLGALVKTPPSAAPQVPSTGSCANCACTLRSAVTPVSVRGLELLPSLHRTKLSPASGTAVTGVPSATCATTCALVPAIPPPEPALYDSV